MTTYKANSINQETNKQTKGATLRANFSGSLRAKKWFKTSLKVLESQNMQYQVISDKKSDDKNTDDKKPKERKKIIIQKIR